MTPTPVKSSDLCLMSDMVAEIERTIARTTDEGGRASLEVYLAHVRAENEMDPDAAMRTMTPDGVSYFYGTIEGPRSVANKDRRQMYAVLMEAAPESWIYQGFDDVRFVADRDTLVHEGWLRVVVRGRSLPLWGGATPAGDDPDAFYEMRTRLLISVRMVEGLMDNEDVYFDFEKTYRKVELDPAVVAAAVARRKQA